MVLRIETRGLVKLPLNGVCLYRVLKKVSYILRDGSTNQNKKKKKSNKHGSGNAYF